jgi:hypothetical protein
MVAQISCQFKYVWAYALINMNMDRMQIWDWMSKPFLLQRWMVAMIFLLLNAQISQYFFSHYFINQKEN